MAETPALLSALTSAVEDLRFASDDLVRADLHVASPALRVELAVISDACDRFIVFLNNAIGANRPKH